MGYTTRFSGKFTLDRLPDAATIVRLRQLEDAEDIPDSPGGYCQWQLTKDCMAIEWDGGEKFYEYDAWLQWIIDIILQPAGLALSGGVDYTGEDARDVGVLSIGPDGRVGKAELPAIREESARPEGRPMNATLAESIVKARRPLARCIRSRGIGITHPYEIDDRVDGVYPPAETPDGAWVAAAGVILWIEEKEKGR